MVPSDFRHEAELLSMTHGIRLVGGHPCVKIRVMKPVVYSLLLLLSLSVAALSETLPDSLSPNKHYQVSLEHDNGRLYYRIKTVRDGRLLLRFPCSYRLGEGTEEWTQAQARAAEIHWRSDSGAVAVDEANHRLIGTVWIARRIKGVFSPLLVNERILMDATQQKWDRGRIFFVDWGKGESIILSLSGLITRIREGRLEESKWRFQIDLLHEGKIVQKSFQMDVR